MLFSLTTLACALFILPIDKPTGYAIVVRLVAQDIGYFFAQNQHRICPFPRHYVEQGCINQCCEIMFSVVLFGGVDFGYFHY